MPAIYFDGLKFAIGVTSQWSGMASLYDSGEGKEQIAIHENLNCCFRVSCNT